MRESCRWNIFFFSWNISEGGKGLTDDWREKNRCEIISFHHSSNAVDYMFGNRFPRKNKSSHLVEDTPFSSLTAFTKFVVSSIKYINSLNSANISPVSKISQVLCFILELPRLMIGLLLSRFHSSVGKMPGQMVTSKRRQKSCVLSHARGEWNPSLIH